MLVINSTKRRTADTYEHVKNLLAKSELKSEELPAEEDIKKRQRSVKT